MEKIIKVDGRDVRLKITAAFPLHFNAMTGKDYFAKDTATQRFYDTIWVLAKCADDTIPAVTEWVESFENFPVISIFNEVQQLIEKATASTVKNGKPATGK